MNKYLVYIIHQNPTFIVMINIRLVYLNLIMRLFLKYSQVKNSIFLLFFNFIQLQVKLKF